MTGARQPRDYASFLAEMRHLTKFSIGVFILANCLCMHAQNPQSKEAPAEAKGLPARATPADYQFHAQAGSVTVAAEFAGHSVPTMQAPLATDDYVVVETALFGGPGARITLSAGDFSLRINGKKVLQGESFGAVLASLNDPEWEPPEKAESKSKSSLSTGGQGNPNDINTPPSKPKVPIELQRAMAHRVQQASLPEGDRALPQAGLVFFPYRGKIQGVHSVELTYTGSDGKVTLKLQP